MLNSKYTPGRQAKHGPFGAFAIYSSRQIYILMHFYFDQVFSLYVEVDNL